MSDAPQAPDLEARLAALGRTLGEREAGHTAELEAARAVVERLHARVVTAVEKFHRAAAAAGAAHLHLAVGEVRVDDKHLRSVEFDLIRGRHRAIVTAKSRGEVTLVGPFHSGKTEGPCKSFPFDAEQEIGEALASFLERFAEEAATP